MDQRGALAVFETEKDAKRAGYTTSLSQKEAAHLMPLNRHERRAELANLRNKVKKRHQLAQRKKRRK